MKKNISINISGIIFNIEEDGYDRLKSYLDEIKRYFATYDDTGEIAADIENRVAEIFLSKLNPQKQVITARDVDSLIAQMGNVQDFEAIEEAEQQPVGEPGTAYESSYRTSERETASEGATAGQETFAGESNVSTKRLYRDGQRKIIAGVAAGIAHYFRIDPFWIRLLFLLILFDIFLTFSFSSLLLIGYIVLWVVVPARYDLAEDRKIKKMFRNPDDKVLGGVASGLAAYFGVDPTLIRILFVIMTFVGGSGLIAYLILWVITPEANTLTDRMQMQGEPVTLANIEHNIKKNLNVKEGEENAVVRVLLFPFRLVSAIFAGAGRMLVPLIRFLGELIRVVAGIALVLLGFGFLLSLFTLTGFAAGFFPEVYIDMFELQVPAAIVQNTAGPLLLASGFFVLFVPGLTIILLGVALLAKRWLLNTAASWVIFGLWILSLITLAFSLPGLIVDFKSRSFYETTETFAADTSQTVVLALMNNSRVDFDNADLRIEPTEGQELRLEKRIYARGRNIDAAKEVARKTQYPVTQKGNTLFLSQNMHLPEDVPFRDQELELTLFMPVGQKFQIKPEIRKILNYTLSAHGYSSHVLRNKPVFVFNEAGELVCLNCPEDADNYRNRDEENFHSAERGEFSREIDADNFREVSVGSAYRVFISQKDQYSIRIEGTEEAVNTVEFDQQGDHISFRNSFSFFDERQGPVNIFISMPELESLDLSGASKARLEGWKAKNLQLDLSGSAEGHFEGDAEKVTASLSGSSELKLIGKGRQLKADLSGSSALHAMDFSIRKSSLDLSGSSRAEVAADEQLDVETSGSSQVSYRGNPSTKIDKSRGSKVEKKRD